MASSSGPVTAYDSLPDNQRSASRSVATTGGDGIVCVALTTSVGGGKHVFDRASRHRLREVTADSSPGFGDFT